MGKGRKEKSREMGGGRNEEDEREGAEGMNSQLPMLLSTF